MFVRPHFLHVSPCLLLAAGVLTAGPLAAGPLQAAAPETTVNATVGDVSWISVHGAPPPADAAEDERIATHLAWVEQRLRSAPVEHLEPAQLRARTQLLDALHAYTAAGAFPRHARIGRGRLPRWVDDEGRHCAVAHLVRVSAGPALVAVVQRAHELDYVADMRVPALVAWAASSGFTLEELALIQPTYDHGGSVHPPTEWEEREEAERRRREARVPRDLTSTLVRGLLEDSGAHHQVAACVGERTGHFQVRSALTVERGLRARARVTVYDLADEGREPALERCLARAAEAIVQAFLRTANYRLRRPIRETHAYRLHAYTTEEIEAAFLARRRPWRGPGTRASALAACVREAPSRGPIRVPIRIASGNVFIRWDDVVPAIAARDDRGLWHCMQDVLIYGRLPEHGFRDHDFDIEVLRDGSIRRAPNAR